MNYVMEYSSIPCPIDKVLQMQSSCYEIMIVDQKRRRRIESSQDRRMKTHLQVASNKQASKQAINLHIYSRRAPCFSPKFCHTRLRSRKKNNAIYSDKSMYAQRPQRRFSTSFPSHPYSVLSIRSHPASSSISSTCLI